MFVFAGIAAIVLGVALVNALGPTVRRSTVGRRWINHMLEAPLGTKHRATAYKWKIVVLRAPGRVHTILLILLWALNFTALFVFLPKFPESAWSDFSDALGKPQNYRLRSTADRLAVLTLTQLPLVFLFAGRNAIPIRMTQCSFNTLMLYHRHFARLVTLEAWFHAALYREYAIRKDHIKQWTHEAYIRSGYFALQIFILVSILSYTPIRQWAYEVCRESLFVAQRIDSYLATDLLDLSSRACGSFPVPGLPPHSTSHSPAVCSLHLHVFRLVAHRPPSTRCQAVPAQHAYTPSIIGPIFQSTFNQAVG